MSLSEDYRLIIAYINSGAKVLDLGCGNGELLSNIKKSKKAVVRGIEKDIGSVRECLAKGVPVYQGEIEEGLKFYKKNFFDIAILSKTIQQLHRPHKVIFSMLEIAEQAFISFHNYGYYLNRLSFFFKGTKPKNLAFPFSWYETDDVHSLSIHDFENFCREEKINIVKKFFLSGDWKTKNYFLPNIFAGQAIYLISKK